MVGTSGPSPPGKAHDVAEDTPLLAAAQGQLPVAAVTGPDAGSENSETATLSSQGSSNQSEEEDNSLPRTQLFLLCYARWVEPVAFFSIFPYINKMAQQNGHLDTADVGYYSGLIESLFSLTQMMVMIFWGKASDRFGRKPVLVFSLIGVSCATSLFGLATTIWEMILFRCLAGVFAGTIVTIRSMFSEHSNARNQARAFSWFSFTGNMGILFGPMIGGTLAEPATQYPKLFGDIQFFVDYPYALPSFAVGCIGLSAVVVTMLYVEETLNRGTYTIPEITNGTTTTYGTTDTGLDEETLLEANKLASMTTWQLLKSPGVAKVLYTYAHVMLLAFAYTAIAPLFMFTPIDLGGFEFTPALISLFMSLNGLAQAIWVLLVFPSLQARIGTLGVIRLCAYVYPLWFIIQPGFNYILRQHDETLNLVFWIFAPLSMCIGSGVSMSFTALVLAINDVSPSPLVFGTLNSLSLSMISGVRSFSPALFTALFAISVNNQWLLEGYSIWVLLVILGSGFALMSVFLPDTEKLREEREIAQGYR
ncbi:protein zinc induced facilitator-LIKE 1 [Rhypophila sp. PSN 637]